MSADSPMVDIVLLGSYVVGAAVLIAVTRGRLGKPVKMRQAESEEESNDNNA